MPVQGQTENLNNDLNARWLYVFNKVQRISFAIYRVTDSLSPKEPIKWRLRDMSFVLIDLAGKILKDNIKDIYIKDSRDILSDMVVLFDIGLISDSFSRMNFEILRNEVLRLRERLDTLLSDFQVVGIAEIEQLLGVSEVQVDKDLFSLGRNVSLDKASILPKSLSHEQKNLSLDSRRQNILKFLGEKKVSGIRDIYNVVSGCSEKTIQRELAMLVKEGLLRKEGEKRWSKYHIIE